MTAAELVERVRRAVGKFIRDDLRAHDAARAAIAATLPAIREPTEAMVEAGDAALYHGDVIDPAHVFRMMIDARIAEVRAREGGHE